VRPDGEHEALHAEALRGPALEAHLASCVECALLHRMAEEAARADAEAQAVAVPLSVDALEAILAAAGGGPGAVILAPPTSGVVPTREPEVAAPRSELRAVSPAPAGDPTRRRRVWVALAFAAAFALAVVAVAAGRRLDRRHQALSEPALVPPALAIEPAPPPSASAEPAPTPSASAAPAEPPRPTATPAHRLVAGPTASAIEPAEPAETAATLFARANEARRAGRGAEALRLYDELGARFPGSREDSAARVTSGWLLLQQLGQPAAALARFDRYLATGGGTLAQEAMAGRALALGKLGRRSDELAAWHRLLEVAPGSAYAPRARERLAEPEQVTPSPSASSSAASPR
jgi:hypothetical protein